MRDSLIARGPDLEPFLRCFVPALVEERLDAGQSGAALHEHRKLISVFMKVRWLYMLRLCLRWLYLLWLTLPWLYLLWLYLLWLYPSRSPSRCWGSVRSRATSRASTWCSRRPWPSRRRCSGTTAPSRASSRTTRARASSSPSASPATSTTTTRSVRCSRASRSSPRSTPFPPGPTRARRRAPTAACRLRWASPPGWSSAERRAGCATASSIRWQGPRSTWRHG